jgi:acyl carrier protein
MTRAAFTRILEDVFGMPGGSLRESDSRDTVAGWSSLVDVQLMSLVSSEFGLEPDVELLSCESVGQLLDVLENKGALTAG